VKEVAQVAACIGREFSYSLIAKVWPSSEVELRAALDKLAAAELIFQRGTPREASYAFKHALVRDAAHESLLRGQRQKIHARIVQALEERFPETVGAEPELLAQHCLEAGFSERPVVYWHQAGQQALVRCAMAEAIRHLTNGLKVLNGLPQGSERLQRELDLQLALGRASIAAKGFAAPETGSAYARARELCHELGATPELFPVLYCQSVFYFQRGELAEVHRIAWELLLLGEQRGDDAAQVTGHRIIGGALCQPGRFTESRDAFEQALALYDPARDRASAVVYAIDSRVMCKSWLAHLYLILGDPERAIARDGEVPAYVREVSNPSTEAVALVWGCIFRQLLRDQQSAQDQAEAVIALATEQGFPLYRAAGSVVGGWVRAASGHMEDGIAEIRQGLADYSATGAEMWSPYFLALQAEALGWAGQAAAGLGTLARALDRVGEIEGRWIEAELHRLRGELLVLAASDHGEAETCFHRGLAIARAQCARMWELRASMSLARLWRDQGKQEEAHALLAPIYGCFTAGAHTPDLREAKALLSAITSCTRPA
jgi:predicted ATPase